MWKQWGWEDVTGIWRGKGGGGGKGPLVIGKIARVS